MSYEKTPNLLLPLLVVNQSGKEITHNEALIIIDALLNNGAIDKDLSTPPQEVQDGDIYIVGNEATDSWLGKDGQVAFCNNGWRFLEPREGLRLWINDEDCIYVYNGTEWVKNSSENYSSDNFSFDAVTENDIAVHDGNNFVNTKTVQNLEKVGIGTTADEYNRLAVASDNVLLQCKTNDIRVKVNKANSENTGSHLFQTNYSGRAEFGLIGSDNFTLKVSRDGSNWKESFVVNNDTGDIDFKNNISVNGSPFSGNSLVLQNYKTGLGIANNSSDSLSSLDILSGMCADNSNSVYMKLNSILTKKINLNWSVGSNNGGFPSGLTLMPNAWYHVFIISDSSGSSIDGGFDTSLNAENLLADSTSHSKFRRVGSVLTNDNKNITEFFQKGNSFLWKSPISQEFLNIGPNSDLKTIHVPNGVEVEAVVNASWNSQFSGENRLYISSPNQDDEISDDGRFSLISNSNEDASVSGQFLITTNELSQIRTRVQDGSDCALSLLTVGWRELF